MISLKSHYTALEILEKVLEGSAPFDENALLFATVGIHVDNDGEEVGCEWFFFQIGSEIYCVSLYEGGGGGEVQRLGVIEAWTAFPSDDNEEEEEDTDVEED